MKTSGLIAVLLLVFSATGASAKKNAIPESVIKVGYTYHHLSQRNDGEVVANDYNYLLLANAECSKYYNYNNEYLDSLDSTPSGRKLSRQLMSIGVEQYLKNGDDSAIPHYKGQIYVFKSLKDGITTVYDTYGLGEQGYYSEPFSEIEWNVTDSVKNILGYECLMAEADYHGRHWTAWFSPDIAVADGPWKLCGLPGLILEATESTGQHSFVATGIENSTQKMFPIYSPEKYDKMKRIDILKAYAAYRKGSDAYARALIMDTPDGSHVDLKAPELPKANSRNIDFLETDYH